MPVDVISESEIETSKFRLVFSSFPWEGATLSIRLSSRGYVNVFVPAGVELPNIEEVEHDFAIHLGDGLAAAVTIVRSSLVEQEVDDGSPK